MLVFQGRPFVRLHALNPGSGGKHSICSRFSLCSS